MSPPSLYTDVSSFTRRIGELMKKVKVNATIPPIYDTLWSVSCVGEAEAWIYGQNETIACIDIHGAVKDTVIIKCLEGPGGISVTRGNELIYSDYNTETVNIVRDGKPQKLITIPRYWRPWRLCCTMSGDILVHVCTGSGRQTKNKIIRYQGKNIKQEINNDGQGNPIIKDGFYSLYISENNYDDVCVSDANADVVVVVDKSGRVRFRYDGTPARRGMPFNPRGIVTDALR
ncbi:uncharacterized protein LOC144623462 [Crassostrea virginica]